MWDGQVTVSPRLKFNKLTRHSCKIFLGVNLTRIILAKEFYRGKGFAIRRLNKNKFCPASALGFWVYQEKLQGKSRHNASSPLVPNPCACHNQFPRSQSHILGGDWLTQQVSESCCALESCEAASPSCMCQCILTTYLWQCLVSGGKKEHADRWSGEEGYLWEYVEVKICRF